MGLCLTSNVKAFPIYADSVLYTCNVSTVSSDELPIKESCEFFNLKPHLSTIKRTHTLTYGILVDPCLSIPIPRDEFKTHPILAIMEFATYAEKFYTTFKKPLNRALIKKLIMDNKIVELWENKTTGDLENIGILDSLKVGRHDTLAAIGQCFFNKKSTSFFEHDIPTNFSVNSLNSKLIALTQEEYDTFIEEFEKALTFIDSKTTLTELQKKHTLTYGIVLDSTLSNSTNDLTRFHNVLTVMEFETYAEKFYERFERPINTALIEKLILDNKIVPIWKNKQTGAIENIGISENSEPTKEIPLEAIGECYFKQGDLIAFQENMPTYFCVKRLLSTKLTPLKQEKHEVLLEQFKRKHLEERVENTAFSHVFLHIKSKPEPSHSKSCCAIQ